MLPCLAPVRHIECFILYFVRKSSCFHQQYFLGNIWELQHNSLTIKNIYCEHFPAHSWYFPSWRKIHPNPTIVMSKSGTSLIFTTEFENMVICRTLFFLGGMVVLLQLDSSLALVVSCPFCYLCIRVPWHAKLFPASVLRLPQRHDAKWTLFPTHPKAAIFCNGCPDMRATLQILQILQLTIVLYNCATIYWIVYSLRVLSINCIFSIYIQTPNMKYLKTARITVHLPMYPSFV